MRPPIIQVAYEAPITPSHYSNEQRRPSRSSIAQVGNEAPNAPSHHLRGNKTPITPLHYPNK